MRVRMGYARRQSTFMMLLLKLFGLYWVLITLRLERMAGHLDRAL
jgi:hypothetical protein